MSDETSAEQPTRTGELGSMPDPESESREPNPGGVDARPVAETNIPADLDPQDNPATEDQPDELQEGEDTETEATQESDSGEVAPEDEAPA